MSDVIASSTSLPEVVHPPAVSLSEIWPWALLGLALLMLVYFVGADEGATSLIRGNVIHEFMHDGRHLLGFPCH
jgi:hypothetical protein